MIGAPLLVALVVLWYRDSRLLFADQLVFSRYAYTWLMVCIVFAQLPAAGIDFLVAIENGSEDSAPWYFYLLVAGLLVYLFIASRRAYELTSLPISVQLSDSPFYFWHFYGSHFVYRLIHLGITIVLI